MKKIISLGGLLLASLVLFCCSFPTAQAQSESYIAVEVNSGRVLYSRNAENIRPVAGLSQVATAIVALDWISRTKVELNRIITVPRVVGTLRGANPMNLVPGDKLTFRDALYSTLLGSDNASALTIAHFVGSDLALRRGNDDPVDEFVSEMNSLASVLGMSNTNFKAPHGLDAGKISESTAADMALLGIYVMRNDAFSFIVCQASRRIGVQTASGTRFFDVKNSNPLLSDPGVDGIKTGSSAAAGPCAMIGAKRATVRRFDPTLGREALYPQRMVVVVLGTSERYSLSRELIREGWREFDHWMKRNFDKSQGEKRDLRLKGSK